MKQNKNEVKVTFSYIRHKIQKYRKIDLLEGCYSYLASMGRIPSALWDIFLLMKWTYLYGEDKYPPKVLTVQEFNKIVKYISELNSDHISGFLKNGHVDKGFHILYSQQFYLQKVVHKEIFAIQLKLYQSLRHKYDIGASFSEKAGLPIRDFVFLLMGTWLFMNANELGSPNFYYDGHLTADFWQTMKELTSENSAQKYFELLTLDPGNPVEKIKGFKRGISKEEFQSLETTFFTMFPFQVYKNQIKVIHESVFNHTVNYYIYDYLKANDPQFTQEFGKRFEKYIELGLQEAQVQYQNETAIKKLLPTGSSAIDFLLHEENIFIECKAVELQSYPAINPTDELLYNSLKDSIIKAYVKQLLPCTEYLNPGENNWGLIITYKQLFWSRFEDVWKLVSEEVKESISIAALPPENVFIIDIYTWNRIVQILKDKKATLGEIIAKVKEQNKHPETKKQLFEMHLDEYDIKKFNFDFLQNEFEQLEIPVKRS